MTIFNSNFNFLFQEPVEALLALCKNSAHVDSYGLQAIAESIGAEVNCIFPFMPKDKQGYRLNHVYNQKIGNKLRVDILWTSTHHFRNPKKHHLGGGMLMANHFVTVANEHLQHDPSAKLYTGQVNAPIQLSSSESEKEGFDGKDLETEVATIDSPVKAVRQEKNKISFEESDNSEETKSGSCKK